MNPAPPSPAAIIQLLHDRHWSDLRQALARLPAPEIADLLRGMNKPGRVTQRLVNLLSAEDRREARELLGYPEDSVGRLMTPDYVAIRPAWTITSAIAHVR